MNELRILEKPNYALLAILAALTAIHFTILFKSTVDSNIVSLHCLLFVGIASLVWEERENLEFNSSPLASLIGIVLIAWILIRTVSPTGYHIAISPIVLGIGFGLVANGQNCFTKYRKELILLSLTALYPLVSAILRIGGITQWTARFATFLLWASGFFAHREGVIIFLPKGRVEVLGTCAGIDSMLLMLTVAVLFFMLIPLRLKDKIICLLVAGVISFFLNSIRVAIMAVLADNGNMQSFEYWHGGNGSLIFSVLSVAIFGCFCWLTYVRTVLDDNPPDDEDSN